MTIALPTGEDIRIPYANFAFHIAFESAAPTAPGVAPRTGPPPPFGPGEKVPPELFGGFSEVSGLEAMMEHKVIKAGGRNYGALLRAGPVSFGTVVLKRGIVRSRHLWRWWAVFAGADGFTDARPRPDHRCNLLIGLISTIGNFETAVDPRAFKDEQLKEDARFKPAIQIGWRLRNAMPVKFRVGDLNAKGSDVAVEELHLVHEGLEMQGVVA